ncbi:MAG: ABC transporter substrate-binding protein [Rhizobiales bacterium]|nr:ABC transporter substrate-binding protein [Hyphomicrobiales bacterium]
MTGLLTRRSALLGGAGILAAPWVARGQAALPRVRLTTGWSFQGTHSFMLRAVQAGYFKEAGAEVVVSRGFGSGRLPVDIAGGVFDIGYGDLSATIKFMADNPDSDVIIVGVLEDTNQTAMTVLADGPIKAPKDIEGNTLAAPESDAGRQLFPAYAKYAGIDLNKITWISVAPELREPMLVQKRATGITGLASSTALGLKRIGVDMPQQRIFFYRDFGINLYSNGFVASRKFAERNPEALKAALAGLFRAYVEYYRDPTDSLKVLAEVEPLTDLKIETERVNFVKEVMPLGKYMQENGISAVEPERLAFCIRTIEDAYGLPKRLSPERVYTDAYLPPASQRMI